MGRGGLINSKPWLAAELVVLFVMTPVAIALLFALGVRPFQGVAFGVAADAPGRAWPQWDLTLLYVLGGLVLSALVYDRRFDNRNLWRASGLRAANLIPMAGSWALAGIVLMAAMGLRHGWEHVFWLGRAFGLGAFAFLFYYGLLLVYPQEIIFRAFFFHRYAPLLRSPVALIAASSAAFGWMHVIYLNATAIVLTLLGGVLMGITYHRTRSMLAVTVEHAVLGWFTFIVGFGPNFYLPVSMTGDFRPPAVREMFSERGPGAAPGGADGGGPAANDRP